MSAKNVAALLFLLSLPAAAQSSSADDEVSQLRAQVSALKARNAALEQACPAAAANLTAAAAATPPAAASSPALPAASPAVVEASPAAPAAPPSPAVAAARQPAQYTKTGCDRGLFSGPAPGKWQDSAAWKKIGKGMTMAEVEAAIGVEHYDETQDHAVQWQYGRCGGRWESSVTFVDGLVVSATPPAR